MEGRWVLVGADDDAEDVVLAVDDMVESCGWFDADGVSFFKLMVFF
jgi:hypothetical protein